MPSLSAFLICVHFNRYRIGLLVVVLFCTFQTHAQYQQLLHRTFAERLLPLKDMYQSDLFSLDSATIFKRINAIKKLATDNNDDDLLMEAALLRVHYFYYKKPPPANLLTMLDTLRQEGVKRNKLWLQIMAENLSALYNFHITHYEQAFEHHQRVYNMIKGLSPEDFPHKQHCLTQLADEYYFFNDYRQSIFYNLQALRSQPPNQLDPFPPEILIMNTLGLCYQNLNRLDSAEFYFKKIIDTTKIIKIEQWASIASGNLGYNLFLEKKYTDAIPLLEKDVTMAELTHDWGLASGSLMVLANISLLNGNTAKGGEQIERCRQYVKQSGQYKRYARLYPLMAKYYALTNNAVLAGKYMDSSFFVKDSLNRQLNALQMLRASQKINLERTQAQIENIESQKAINTLQRNALLGILVIMIAGTLLVYREQRKRIRLQKELVEKTKSELEDATRQLNDFARNVSEKSEIFELLGQHDQAGKNAISQLQQSTILTDTDWAYFKGLFEKVHSGYLDRLREKLPGLTPAEVRFMALTKLGLNSREMASMLGIGTDAVRQYRLRLRKKFDLSDDGSIEELAAQI